jgi:TusE/DsrC/DsvC family sulfur relay protein
MSIRVDDRLIETDEEGYLIDPNDWSEAVAEAIAAAQSPQEGVTLTETHRGLIDYFRDYYAENQSHPSMHQLVMTLGQHHGQHFSDRKTYEAFLYRLFPRGPVLELCKLAGLPKPTESLAG